MHNYADRVCYKSFGTPSQLLSATSALHSCQKSLGHVYIVENILVFSYKSSMIVIILATLSR